MFQDPSLTSQCFKIRKLPSFLKKMYANNYVEHTEPDLEKEDDTKVSTRVAESVVVQ